MIYVSNSKITSGLVYLQGFVITDYAGIDQITTPSHANYTYSIVAGINAGIDMVCWKFLF